MKTDNQVYILTKCNNNSEIIEVLCINNDV